MEVCNRSFFVGDESDLPKILVVHSVHCVCIFVCFSRLALKKLHIAPSRSVWKMQFSCRFHARCSSEFQVWNIIQISIIPSKIWPKTTPTQSQGPTKTVTQHGDLPCPFLQPDHRQDLLQPQDKIHGSASVPHCLRNHHLWMNLNELALNNLMLD